MKVKNKVFHITVASKRINGKFEAIKNYVESIPCNFEGSFDNIGIYKWVIILGYYIKNTNSCLKFI